VTGHPAPAQHASGALRLFALAGLALIGPPAFAPLAFAPPAFADVPPVDYFTGVYERIGRSGGANPVLLNDLWRIDPAPDGALRLSPCARTEPRHDLRFARLGDLTNLLAGEGGLWCQVFNDGGNYPLFSCGAEDGSAFQMRVVTDDRAAGCVAG